MILLDQNKYLLNLSNLDHQYTNIYYKKLKFIFLCDIHYIEK
jgi:hypothetical protein